jgi:hypothetical protein
MGRPNMDYDGGNLKWYRLALPTYRGLECRAAVTPVTRATGYVLQTTIVVLSFVAGLFAMTYPGVNVTQIAISEIGALALVALLAAACSKWGFNYRRP